MATGEGVRLPAFPDATGFSDADFLFMTQDGATVKGTIAQLRTALATNALIETFAAGPTFTALISGNTLTVSAFGAGAPLAIGQTLFGAGVTGSPTITALGTGTGGAGTYTLSASLGTVASEAMGAASSTQFAPGFSTSITVVNTYGSMANIGLFFDDGRQFDCTLSGQVVGFNPKVPSGVQNVYVTGRAAIPIGTPASGSVVDATVASGAAINAAKLSYISPLPNTVPRTVASKEADFINAREFGVKANGSDDSAAMNLALNTVANLNGTLCLPQGTILASNLSVNQTNHFITLRGAGMFATTLVTNSAAGDFLTFQTAGYELKDLQLSANVTRVSGAHFVTSSNQGLINNIGINAALTGIIMQDGFCSMRKLTFTGPVNGTISMIINGAGAGMVIDDMTCYTGVTGTAAAGIKVVAAGSVQISNSNIVGQGFDLWIAPGTGQGVASIYALNTFFDTATAGVVIAPTGTGFVDRCRFDSCWMCSHATAGTLIQNTGTGTIGGIHFVDCEMSFCVTGSGFIVTPQTGPLPTDVTILGGIYSGNVNGIDLPAGMSDFTIMGVTAGVGGDGPANSGIGIFLAPGASDHYIISNNRVRGNGLANVSDGGTGTNKSVTGNIS